MKQDSIKSDQVYQVFGHSMWPYLRDGDFLYTEVFNSSQGLRPGMIVGFKTERDFEVSFHRVIDAELQLIKGDYEPLCDQEFYDSIELSSLATYRIYKEGSELTTYSLQNSGLQPLYSLLAKASSLRFHNSNIVSKLSKLVTITLGLSLRTLEKWLSQSKSTAGVND